MNRIPDQYPIADGFLLDTQNRCDMRFMAHALQEYEPLRRSGSYRSKIWTIPDDVSFVIPAFNVYKIQLTMVPGSAIWGYCMTATNPGDFSIEIQDSCNDVKLFSAALAVMDNSPMQSPFPRLLIVGEPGDVHVEICSLKDIDETSKIVQLVLFGGEPVCG